MGNNTWIIIAVISGLVLAAGIFYFNKRNRDQRVLNIIIPPASELYVANLGGHSILGFEIKDNGLALSPGRVIQGPNTGLHNPVDVALDNSNRICVANLGDPPGNLPSITIYAWNANGNSRPLQTIPLNPIFFGNIGDPPIAICTRQSSPQSLFVAYKTEISGVVIIDELSMVSGNFVFTNSFEDPQLTMATGIKIGGANNLFVANMDINDPDTNSILVFNAQAQAMNYGNLESSISGNNTGLYSPAHICFGPFGSPLVGRLFVVNREGANHNPAAKITVYDIGAIDNAQPIRVIWGSNTRLSSAYGIAVDRVGRIYVSGQNSVHMFAADADGNVSPAQTIDHADISSPVGLVARLA